jgi:hypothetical protein
MTISLSRIMTESRTAATGRSSWFGRGDSAGVSSSSRRLRLTEGQRTIIYCGDDVICCKLKVAVLASPGMLSMFEISQWLLSTVTTRLTGKS